MDDNSLKRFGEYIKLLRETEGMSQEELARKSGFAGRAAISALEKGKTNISVDRLQDLAIALHTTPGKMLDVIVGHSVSMDTFGTYGHIMESESRQTASIIDLTLGDILGDTSSTSGGQK